MENQYSIFVNEYSINQDDLLNLSCTANTYYKNKLYTITFDLLESLDFLFETYIQDDIVDIFDFLHPIVQKDLITLYLQLNYLLNNNKSIETMPFIVRNNYNLYEDIIFLKNVNKKIKASEIYDIENVLEEQDVNINYIISPEKDEYKIFINGSHQNMFPFIDEKVLQNALLQ